MLFKLYSILVVYANRRKPCFVAYELFVIQRMVAAKPPRVFRVPHQVYHANVLAHDLRLKAVLLVSLACLVEFFQIFLIEDYFHKVCFAGQS